MPSRQQDSLQPQTQLPFDTAAQENIVAVVAAVAVAVVVAAVVAVAAPHNDDAAMGVSFAPAPVVAGALVARIRHSWPQLPFCAHSGPMKRSLNLIQGSLGSSLLHENYQNYRCFSSLLGSFVF